MRKPVKILASYLGAAKELTTKYAELAEITEDELNSIRASVVARPDRLATVKLLSSKGMSTRQIADITGWDHSTIVRDLQKARGANAPKSGANAPDDDDEDDEDERPSGFGNGADKPSDRELLGQSDQNDWRTPRKYLDAARKVLGAIDLDPATSVEANETVKATKIYTEEDNGLEKPWKGRVWLNPPYGGQARLFVERLLKEYQVGNVTGACLLVNSHPTETKWFQALFDYPVCFIHGRIDFGGPSREVSSTSTHGSAIVYLGEKEAKFGELFSAFGAVVKKI